MNSLIDVSRFGEIKIIKELSVFFDALFGLKLSFYRFNGESASNFCRINGIGKSTGAGSVKCEKVIAGDVKRAIEKKKTQISSCQPGIKRFIVPILFRKKVYGIAVSNGIRVMNKDRLSMEKKERGKSVKKKLRKEGKEICVLDKSRLDQLCFFLESFVNYVFMSKFEEMVFMSSELSQTHLQESIARAIDHIRENYYRPNLSLGEVSKVVSLSPYYFSHQFKKEYNATFIEYLTKIRLEAAVRLLKDRRLSVAQVSFAAGYQDPNYFSKVFKKWMNISPQEYRDQIVDQKVS
ncbi:MAG: AraC family transcriptional regulator [Candidatus Omnitrophica bacterium]|nr:AraC family transcriptional regulator [Candidatus Omnitrophota bacterium]